jgi:hypothetical protein
LEKINKIEKHLTNLNKMKREKTQISNIGSKKGSQKGNVGSSGTTKRTYIHINQKILRK